MWSLTAKKKENDLNFLLNLRKGYRKKRKEKHLFTVELRTCQRMPSHIAQLILDLF